MNKLNKFSVIIACYNSEKYIEEAIDSIINQTYPHYELIIINDGSTDNTPYILKKYKNKNQKINIYNNSNNGLAFSRNFAVQKCKYEWVVIMDHDDISKSNRLYTYNKIINEN